MSKPQVLLSMRLTKIGILVLVVMTSINQVNSDSVCGAKIGGTHISGILPSNDPTLIGFSYFNYNDSTITGQMILNTTSMRLNMISEITDPVTNLVGDNLEYKISFGESGMLTIYNEGNEFELKRNASLLTPIYSELKKISFTGISQYGIEYLAELVLEDSLIIVSRRLDRVIIAINLNETSSLLTLSLSDPNYYRFDKNSVLAKVLRQKNLLPYTPLIVFDDLALIILGEYLECEERDIFYFTPIYYHFNETSVGKIIEPESSHYINRITHQIIFHDSETSISVIDLDNLTKISYEISPIVIEQAHSQSQAKAPVQPIWFITPILLMVILNRFKK